MFSEYQKKIIDKLSKIDNVESNLYALLNENNKKLLEIKKLEDSINTIIKEKSLGFPWLATAFAEFFELCDLQISEFLERKLRPAKNTAERLKEIAKEKRVLQKEFLIAKNFVKYYESLFPWITEYVGEDLDTLISQVTSTDKSSNNEEDPVLQYIPKAEFQKLSVQERNQKALDRYLNSRKSSWQIGRDYERYIGYLKESDGYEVFYQGIEFGLEDLGRDLICRKNNNIEIIQCKCWAKHKTIHEKHINQLFGTTVKYYLDNFNACLNDQLFKELLDKGIVKAKFYTLTKLSDTALNFAKALDIEIFQDFPLKDYPLIKCNISKATKEKIYHLPFDQRYDDVKIEKSRGEFYAKTVTEAENAGFRRAWKWHSDKSNSL